MLVPWTAVGRSEKEIQEIKDFSNPKKNSSTRDPRTEAQIKAYRQKEAARIKWLQEYRQWEEYRITLGDGIPKTFSTFQKHKLADDSVFQKWQYDYRKRFYLQQKLDYNINGKHGFIPTGAKFLTTKTIAGLGSKKHSSRRGWIDSRLRRTSWTVEEKSWEN